MGWMKCDGRALSKTTYNILYQVLGGAFGETASEFYLPNAQGRVPGAIGSNSSNMSNWALGDTYGEDEHTLIINEMPAHTHGSNVATGNDNGNGNTTTDGLHDHSINDPGHAHSLPLSSAALTGIGPTDDVTQGSGYITGSNTTGITVNSNGNHFHQIFNTGGGAPHNNMQPTIFMGNMFMFSGKVRPTASNYYPYAAGTTIF